MIRLRSLQRLKWLNSNYNYESMFLSNQSKKQACMLLETYKGFDFGFDSSKNI